VNLKRNALLGLLTLAAAGGLAACGDPQVTPTPAGPTQGPATATKAQAPTNTPAPPTDTPIPLPTATPTSEVFGPSGGPNVSKDLLDLLTKTALVQRNLKSYHFTLQNSVERTTGVTAATSEGDFQAPDKRRLALNLGPLGTTEIVIIGQNMYYRQNGSSTYTMLGGASNPLGSFGATAASQDPFSIVRAMTSAQVVGDEQLDGIDVTHLKFSYDVEKALGGNQARAGTTPPAAVSGTATTPSPAATSLGAPPGATEVPTAAGSMGIANGELWIEKSTSYVR
jgi:hypothetical protein